jgi:hypothetical protein
MNDFFEDHSGAQGYQTIIYGKRMLDMMKDGASPDVKSLLNRISSIRIISTKKPEDRIVGLSREDVMDSMEYETISQINENGNRSEFYISEESIDTPDVSFVMIVSGPHGSAVMEIIGDFDVKEISKLSVIGQKR